MAIEVDVVIVGGGLAGLSAADTIVQFNKAAERSVSFVVLEAESRLGGRTYTADQYVDLGGAYVGTSQNYIQFLIRRLRLPTIKTYLPSDKSWLYQDGDGIVGVFPGNDSFDLPGGQDALEMLGTLDWLSLQARAHQGALDSWPMAREFDRVSVQTWLDSAYPALSGPPADGLPADDVPPDDEDPPPVPASIEDVERRKVAREVFVASVRSAFSVEPHQLSMLYLLHYAGCAGGFSALVDVTGGDGAAEGTRLLYGTKHLVDSLVAELGPALRVEHGAVVTDITQFSAADGTATHAVVRATQGTTVLEYSASRVVVAVSTADKHISHTPPLDHWDGGKRSRLVDAMFMGQTIKGFVFFKRPFWRDLGLMGYALCGGSDFATRPLDWVLDNCWMPGTLPTGANVPAMPRHPYSLMTFIVGDSAAYWGPRPFPERANQIVAHLKALFGDLAETELLQGEAESSYVELDWRTMRSEGCPGGLIGPGVFLDNVGALKARHGVISWAGSESADEWCGYMDGALQSGNRAANEALVGAIGTRMVTDSVQRYRLPMRRPRSRR